MNNIIDPVNGNSYDVFSFEGKNLLKNYVKVFQNGGDRSDVYNTSFSSEKDTDKALNNEKKRCMRTENTGPYCKCITNNTGDDCNPGAYIGFTGDLRYSHKSIATHHVNKINKAAPIQKGFICPICKQESGSIEKLDICNKRCLLIDELKKYPAFYNANNVDELLKEVENNINDLTEYETKNFPKFPHATITEIKPMNNLIQDIVHNFNINTDEKNKEVDKALRDWIYALQQKVLANESSVEETVEQTTDKGGQGQSSDDTDDF